MLETIVSIMWVLSITAHVFWIDYRLSKVEKGETND